MRNLKRVLALALALVMTLGLMITASAASYADADQIDANYNEAIKVLTNMGVFRGQANGGESTEFAPKDILTRAEAATLVYRLLTADVADAKTSNYDYTSFDDVKEGEWWTGYITYAANGKYVVGYGNGKFGPNDQVTGIEVLTIMLRALGYGQNGEFVGGGWKDHVVTTANENGMLKNVLTNDLDKGASRELVAQLLFNAITAPYMVSYAPLTGYTKTAQTLGEKNFGLVEIEGVVTANEYADLDSEEPLAAGKTVIGGKTYNISTALTDIGESRRGWATGKDVLYIDSNDVNGNALNTVFQTGAATDISSASKFQKATGLKEGGASYLNFGGDYSVYTSDYRIAYVVTVTAENETAAEAAAAKLDLTIAAEDFDEVAIVTDADADNGIPATYKYTYEKSFRVDDPISSTHMDNIEELFSIADKKGDNYVTGEVYVGTKSTSDISDRISFKTFKAEYINNENDDADISKSDNGEWLKVVDNDGDGEADYVFLTEFAMAEITAISKKGVYTLSELEDKDDAVAFATTKIESKDMVTSDELAVGDIVLYTKIDGVYYVDIAEVVTETIDKKGINSKTETITCDGTDYVQSHIGYPDEDETAYYSDVTDAHTEETYDLYLDHFGYVRLFIESDYNAFLLLTDGYYSTNKKTETYKAEYWNVEDEEAQEITVIGKTAEAFINDDEVNNDGDRDTWRRLIGAGEFYFGYESKTNTTADPFITNIAGYSAGDDGYTLVAADDSTRRSNYDVQELKVTTGNNGTSLKDRLLYTADGGRVQTTTNTQYYLVIKGTDKYGDYVDEVLTWTGYANAPKGAALDTGAVAYAVTHEGSKDTATYVYDVADVVVFETDPTADHNTYFVYETNNYTKEYVWALGYDEEDNIVDDRVDVEEGTETIEKTNKDTKRDINFFEIYEDTTVAAITSNYASKNIYAGEVSVRYNVTVRDYFQVDDTAAGYLRFNPEEVTIYKVTGASNKDAGTYDVKVVDNWDEIKLGNQMILFTDGTKDNNVEYAIIVNMSTWTDKNKDSHIYSDVQELYDAIVADAKYKEYTVTLKNNVANTTATLTTTNSTGTTTTLASVAGADGEKDIKVEKDTVLTLTVKEDQGYNKADSYFVEVDNVQTNLSSGTLTVTVTGNTTITIQGDAAAAIQYTVKYDMGETGVTAPANSVWTVANAATFELPESTKDGYTFEGWFSGEEEVKAADITEASFNANKELTLSAKFTANTNKVTLTYVDPDGNAIGDVADKVVTVVTDTTKEVVLGTDADKVYAVDGDTENLYAANETYTISNVTKDTTIEVTVYPATIKVSVTPTTDITDGNNDKATLVWAAAIDGKDTVDTGKAGTVTLKLTGTGSAVSTFNRTRTVTYKVGDGAEQTFTFTKDDLSSSAYSKDINIPASFEDVTITIVGIAW